MNLPMIALLLLTACATSPKAPAPTSAIIFVPGYYGTALKDERSGGRFFITAGRYLFGSDAVSLHVRDLATPRAPDLVVDQVIDRVRVVPGIYSLDVYGRFMKLLERMAQDRHAEFVPFAYDWRQDLSDGARRLDGVIRNLRERGITDIEIVAHSMGCLVTTYYLGYGGQTPEDARLDWSGAARIDRAVLMAGPYRGAFSLFRNMQLGAAIGSNRSYLPAGAVASMPASYQLLPMLDFHLLDHAGGPAPFAVDAVDQWERLRLGLFRDQALPPEVLSRRRDFVGAQLARAKVMAKLLEFEGAPAPQNLRVLALTGRGISVVDSGFFDPNAGTFVFDTDRPEKLKLPFGMLFKDGDGSVTVRSARPPEGLRARVLTTTKPHDRVFEDAKFIAELRDFSK